MSKKFGATGLYPKGKMQSQDEGELQFGITHHDGRIVMSFGKPVAWLGLYPDDARRIAELLNHHAGAVEQELVRTQGH